MQPEQPVTRIEIAAAIAAAFGASGVGRADILAAATAHRSRPAVIDTLRRLPERRYVRLNELWDDLDEVPLGG